MTKKFSKVLDLNTFFNSLLLKKIDFILDDVIIKSGRIKLFTMDNYWLKFFIISENEDIKTIEMPYPFQIYKTDKGIAFNYRIDKIDSNKVLEVIEDLEKSIDCNHSRFYDKILYLKVHMKD